MYLEIECIGKCLGSLRGGERETMGSLCHCRTLQPTVFRKCSCGHGHQETRQIPMYDESW